MCVERQVWVRKIKVAQNSLKHRMRNNDGAVVSMVCTGFSLSCNKLFRSVLTSKVARAMETDC